VDDDPVVDDQLYIQQGIEVAQEITVYHEDIGSLAHFQGAQEVGPAAISRALCGSARSLSRMAK
jgi:hypothetical protein